MLCNYPPEGALPLIACVGSGEINSETDEAPIEEGEGIGVLPWQDDVEYEVRYDLLNRRKQAHMGQEMCVAMLLCWLHESFAEKREA